MQCSLFLFLFFSLKDLAWHIEPIKSWPVRLGFLLMSVYWSFADQKIGIFWCAPSPKCWASSNGSRVWNCVMDMHTHIHATLVLRFSLCQPSSKKPNRGIGCSQPDIVSLGISMPSCGSFFSHDWLSSLLYLNQRLYHSFLILEQFPAVATVMFSFVLFAAALALRLYGASAAPQSACSLPLSLYLTTDNISSFFSQFYKCISD